MRENKVVLIRSYGKTEFSDLYYVHWKTIKKWLGEKNVKDLELNTKLKIIKPTTVQKIIEILGEPS